MKESRPMYTNIEDAIAAVDVTGGRVMINSELACKLTGTNSEYEAMEELGCGRHSILVTEECKRSSPYILVAEKEVYPPVFWVGEC